MTNNLINKILEELQVEENRERFNNNQNSNMRVGVSLVPRKIIFYGTGADDNDFDSQSFEHKISILLTAFATLPYFLNTPLPHQLIANSYYGNNKTYEVKLGEFLANTLNTKDSKTNKPLLLNPDWLEVLEETYNQNV
jgi:hypothetical protein